MLLLQDFTNVFNISLATLDLGVLNIFHLSDKNRLLYFIKMDVASWYFIVVFNSFSNKQQKWEDSLLTQPKQRKVKNCQCYREKDKRMQVNPNQSQPQHRSSENYYISNVNSSTSHIYEDSLPQFWGIVRSSWKACLET